MEKPTSKRHLSSDEKYAIVKVYDFIELKKKEGSAYWRGRTREHVAECLDYAPSTVSSVTEEWNIHKDRSFPAPPSSRGRPSRSSADNFGHHIRQFINEQNRECNLLTAQVIRDELKKVFNVSIEVMFFGINRGNEMHFCNSNLDVFNRSRR